MCLCRRHLGDKKKIFIYNLQKGATIIDPKNASEYNQAIYLWPVRSDQKIIGEQTNFERNNGLAR